jgi:hypothetical protein
MGCIIAVLLYADDAAIPADSLEDLQLAASIAEQFFNESQLYISTPKTFVTIFHTVADEGVTYQGDTAYVDGVPVDVRVYGERIKAAATFKYLGVHFNEFGDNATHMKEKTAAFTRAANLLFASLRRIPSYSFEFAMYLWRVLVIPVVCYGFEVFSWGDNDLKELNKCQKALWRYLLDVGGRAPTAATLLLLEAGSCVTEWRVRRAGLFFRLLRTPAGSWTQLALISLHELRSPWFQQATTDLQVVLPGATFQKRLNSQGLFLDFYSGNARASRHITEMQRSANGIAHARRIKSYTRTLLKDLRSNLLRSEREVNVSLLKQRFEDNPFSKGSLLIEIRGRPSPRLSIALNWSGPRLNRAAVASLLCGDWFLAIHAGNFFAKEFIPKSQNHIADTSSLGIEPSRVCLSCWHRRRQICLEDEGHVSFECPEYDNARDLLLQQLSVLTRSAVEAAIGVREKLIAILCCTSPDDWKAFGEFAARTRQTRRKIRRSFEILQARLTNKKFEHRRVAWQQRGQLACRHGVLFDSPKGSPCPCMLKALPEDAWSQAKYMAAIDHDIKAIIAAPFALATFRRLGQLKAELKRLNYS